MNTRLGPLRVRVQDFDRPFAALALFEALLVTYAWRRRQGTVLAIVLGAVVVVAGLAIYARTAPHFAPVGDLASIESWTHHATHGGAALGPYSRFEWNHPGPLYFYLLAPFYGLSGFRTVGLFTGALVINAVAACGAVWLAWRHGRPTFAVLVAASVTLYVMRAAESLGSAWNPHVLTLPLMAFILACAAFVAGNWSYALCVTAVGSFLIQTHVGLAPVVTVLFAGSLVSAYWSLRAPSSTGDRAALRRALAWSAVVGFALWAPPLAEQLVESPGNMTKVVEFFLSADEPNQPWATAFAAWTDSISGPFRPDFEVAWGRLHAASSIQWVRAVPPLLALLLVVSLAAERRRQDRFHAACVTVVLVACAVSLWSVTRLKGGLVDHAVFWLAGIGAVGVPLIFDQALAVVAPRNLRRTAAGVCVLLLVVVIGMCARQLRRSHLIAHAPEGDRVVAAALWDSVRAYDQGQERRKYLVRIEHPTWPIAGAVVLQMQKANIPFAVESPWLPMFSANARLDGSESATLAIVQRRTLRQFVDELGYELVAIVGDVAIVSAPLPRLPEI